MYGKGRRNSAGLFICLVPARAGAAPRRVRGEFV